MNDSHKENMPCQSVFIDVVIDHILTSGKLRQGDVIQVLVKQMSACH